MAYELPALDYDYSALEPHIDARTMEIHHTKHHQAYINNVNEALKGSAMENLPVEQVVAMIGDVPENIRNIVRNNGGGHANHALFWKVMSPSGGGSPTGALAEAIDRDIGGFSSFKEQFSKAAATRFGSGWAWLNWKGSKLLVESSANQDSPLMEGGIPLLGLDVWEHAYYLKYQNRRPEYVSAFFEIINWEEVARRFGEAQGSR